MIGDNVEHRLAAEGQSKTYDVGTVVGRSTASRAPDFAFLELDLLKVKGKTEATRIFALIGDKAFKQSRPFLDFTETTPRSWPSFAPRIGTKPRRFPANATGSTARVHRLYALYRERIAYFRQNPPRPTGTGPPKPIGK